MRKSILLLCLLFIALGLFQPKEALALQFGDWTYEIVAGAAKITGYTGSAAEVIIPENIGAYNVTQIAPKTFGAYNYSSVKTVTVPKTVTVMHALEKSGEDYVLRSCFYGNNNISAVIFANGMVTIPEYACVRESKITSVNMPSTITKINPSAFAGTGLTSVTIPGNVGQGAFSACNNLTNVNLLDGVTSIDTYGFGGCSKLNSINFGNSLQSINTSAFDSCTGLTAINLPESLTRIDAAAFSGCTGLTSVTIPKNVQEMGYNLVGAVHYPVFKDCINLRTVVFANGMTNIPANALVKANVENVAIPATATSIGIQAFKDCVNLTSITIPENITNIGAGAFNGCAGLVNINLPEGLTSISTFAFAGCTGLTSINIPNSITSIDADAFAGCTKLISVIIPDNSANSIGNRAFQNCSQLSSIYIGDGVESVGDYAFDGCTSLMSVRLPQPMPIMGTSAFRGTPVEVTILSSHFNIDEVKQAAQAAQAAAGTAATQASQANTSATTAVSLLNAPLITQFQVNGGALEKSGTESVTAGFKAQNSPKDISYNQIQYRITRINSAGSETLLVNWTSFASNSAAASITPVSGINNLVLYVRNTSSGAISKATATLIAGTDAEREVALQRYYGDIYTKAKDASTSATLAKTAADNAKTAADNVYNQVKPGSVLANNISNAADRTIYKAADGTEYSAARWAHEAYNLASKANDAANSAKTSSDQAKSAVQDDNTTAIKVLNDSTKGLIQTYDKANVASSQATVAVTELQSNTYGLNKIKTDTVKVVSNTQVSDGATTKSAAQLALETKTNTQIIDDKDGNKTKSAAQLAKEARDKVNDISQAITPTINSVKGENGATCTTGSTFTVVISASNATEYCARVSNGSWTAWVTSNIITVSGISGTGAKTIEVQARSSPSGTPATDSIVIFKI